MVEAAIEGRCAPGERFDPFLHHLPVDLRQLIGQQHLQGFTSFVSNQVAMP
jgi:hypothetical protein